MCIPIGRSKSKPEYRSEYKSPTVAAETGAADTAGESGTVAAAAPDGAAFPVTIEHKYGKDRQS